MANKEVDMEVGMDKEVDEDVEVGMDKEVDEDVEDGMDKEVDEDVDSWRWMMIKLKLATNVCTEN